MARIATSPTGSRARWQRGFTLLEILVVLVLLAVITAIAGYRFAGSFERPALKQAANEMASVLRQARGEALARNEIVPVRVDVDGRVYGIPGERTYTIPERFRVTLFTAANAQLAGNVGEFRFFPDGSSTGGEVGLQGESANSYIQVDWLTGRVAVYEENPPAQAQTAQP